MNKKLSLFVLFVSVLFYWCSKIDTEINYTENSEITWYEYSKLSYLLEWVIDIENDKADIWNKPLSTDKQKWRFIFDILNNNYMDKYENPIEASDERYYPVIADSLLDNDWDEHDAVYPYEEWIKVAYNKEEIDLVMKETFWDILKSWKNITTNWLILSWDNYLLFNYLYYWSDLVWNKWRATQFNVESIDHLKDGDYEIKAKYFDDILEDLENEDCSIIYHVTSNPKSFFGVSIKEYLYSWCKINNDYLEPDLPSQIIYWLWSWMFNDYIWLNKDFKSVEEHIDLNNDWIDEFFRIWVNSPNWSQIIWVNWDKWYNFILDFTNNIVDEDNTLRDWLFVDIYFENIDWWDELETIVSIWDKKTWSESNIYKLWWEDWFTRIGTIYWDSYLLYESSSKAFHAPYSKNWKCAEYHIVDWRIWEVAE